MSFTIASVLGEGKGGAARFRLKEAGAKSTSRRTETAYKAWRVGESAQHDETPDPARRVNAAVAGRQFTFLSGETCLACGPGGSARGGNVRSDQTGVSSGHSSPSSRCEGPNSKTGECPSMLSDRNESERRSGR